MGRKASRLVAVVLSSDRSRPSTGRARAARRCRLWPEWSVPVVQDDLDAFQEPPPKDWLPAFICQVPDMELPETEPE